MKTILVVLGAWLLLSVIITFPVAALLEGGSRHYAATPNLQQLVAIAQTATANSKPLVTSSPPTATATLLPDLAPTLAVVAAEMLRPTATPFLPPANAAILSIPSINIYKTVGNIPLVNGAWQTDQLKYSELGQLAGLGHVPGEGQYPLVIAGHTVAGEQRGAFEQLHTLNVGDTLAYTDHNGTTNAYTITGKRVLAPSESEALYQGNANDLYLLTCGDWNSNTHQFDSRILVSATRQ